MSVQDDIERIEQERKEREAALLLLLLALTDKARPRVTAAIRLGVSWEDALRSVLLGNEALDLAGGAPMIARILGDSYTTGFQQAGTLVGEKLEPLTDKREVSSGFQPIALAIMFRIYDGLRVEIAAGIQAAQGEDRIAADVDAVRTAFRKFVDTGTPEKKKASEAQKQATAAVTQAYAAGMWEGYSFLKRVGALLLGLRFVAVRDERTTVLCKTYDGTQLPLDHPWFVGRVPPLHWNCRSLLMPLIRPFTATANPPLSPAPMPGFGGVSLFGFGFRRPAA